MIVFGSQLHEQDDDTVPMELGSPGSTASSISEATSLFPVPSSHSSQTSLPDTMSPSRKSRSPPPSQPPIHRSPHEVFQALSLPAYSPKISAGSTPLAPLVELDRVESPQVAKLPTQSLLFEGGVPLGVAATSYDGEGCRKNNGGKVSIRSMFVPAKLATGPTDALASIPVGASLPAAPAPQPTSTAKVSDKAMILQAQFA